MKAVTFLLFFTAFICGCFQAEQDRVDKYEVLLLNTIFKDYDKRSRPVKNYHSPVEANFSISLHQILQVDEKNQIITTNLWRNLFWRDNSLIWNPKDYGNISQISLQRNQIWVPDIQLYNSVSSDTQIVSNTRINLRHDGQISDVLPMVIKSTCKIDVTWFPFDEQKCLLTFGSWTLSSLELRLELFENAAYTGLYVINGEWNLLSANAEMNLVLDPYIPTELYTVITYTIRLKRRALYYFFNLLFPSALIGFLAVLGFTLPPESGEKLPLGATILFSLIVFLNMISESMPANSDAVPLLGTYFNCVMITIALSVVSTVVVNLNLNALNPTEVNGLSKKVFLCWLPWILRIKTRAKVLDQSSFAVKKIKFRDAITDLNSGISTDKIWKQQWKIIAAVVDRFCLICSFLFTFVSVTVFLIYAF